MEARLGSDGCKDGFAVGTDVRLVKRRFGRDVLAPTSAEIVEHVNLVAALEERVDDMRADEARPTCHDHPHCGI